MARKKKKGNQDKAAKLLVLITSILNLIRVTIELVNTLLE